MRFSIVATVRNEVDSIEPFVRSLLDQDRVPDEIVIVDGASTDGTLEMLRSFAESDGIRVISEPCNIAQGRNLGIARATGTHIAVTDAGCEVDSGWLREIANRFESEPSLEVVAGNFRFETLSWFEEAVVKATFQPNRDDSQAARFYPSSRSVAFSKAAWARAGGYPEWLYAAEDTLFNIRLRQVGAKFAFCREAIVRWRPRASWGSLARQRINFSRGNARVGIGTGGYVINLRVHAAVLALLGGGIGFPPLVGVALLVLYWHFRRHLWPQAAAASSDTATRLRVVVLMEFVRIVGMYGFARGRMDRLLDPSFITNQRRYMGLDSVESLSQSDPEAAVSEVTGRPARAWLRVVLGNRLALPGTWRTTVLDAVALVGLMSAALAYAAATHSEWAGLGPLVLTTFVVTAAWTLLLVGKSVANFTQTGPRIRTEVLSRYRHHTVLSVVRLSAWSFVLIALMAGAGIVLCVAWGIVWDRPVQIWAAAVAASSGIVSATLYQLCRKLLSNPGLVTASMHYLPSRLYPLWDRLTKPRLDAIALVAGVAAVSLLASAGWKLTSTGAAGEALALAGAVTFYASVAFWAGWSPEPKPENKRSAPGGLPNIVLIGSDTLRADRVSGTRALTPTLDRMAQSGAYFSHCYVPCARTAPSLISLLSGTWPVTHGVRDNFVSDDETSLPVTALPGWLKDLGYYSATISDWCGSDMGKFDFGFDYVDVPEDQWNLKYLISQGPKDIRLFLSLFMNNRLGRVLLPQIFYLGGVPQTTNLGKRARELLGRLANARQPFLLNIFYSTTHPPFASEWPWYVRYTDPKYRGESKFAMARLTDPIDILRRTAEPREEFDLDQIVQLYDGCVAQFDHEVERLLFCLEQMGLTDDTIVVVYSDHGMEFFEHGTWGQGNSAVGDVSPRVPLIIHDPRRPAVGTVAQVVRSIDVAPTILDLVGGVPPKEVDGSSLKAIWDDPTLDLELCAFNETGIWLTDMPGLPSDHLRYPDLLELMDVPDEGTGTLALKSTYRRRILAAKDRMIREGRWKLVYQPLEGGRRLLLFDVATDAECQHDVAKQHPDVAAALWARLATWIDEWPDSAASGPDGSQHPGVEAP